MRAIAIWLSKAWVLLRDRPLVPCPACKGAGGETAGYYEPEFQECRMCYGSWTDAEDYGIGWAWGRIDPLQWPWAKLYAVTGQFRFRDWVACALGRHQRWAADDCICIRCYEDLPPRSPEVEP